MADHIRFPSLTDIMGRRPPTISGNRQATFLKDCRFQPESAGYALHCVYDMAPAGSVWVRNALMAPSSRRKGKKGDSNLTDFEATEASCIVSRTWQLPHAAKGCTTPPFCLQYERSISCAIVFAFGVATGCFWRGVKLETLDIRETKRISRDTASVSGGLLCRSYTIHTNIAVK